MDMLGRSEGDKRAGMRHSGQCDGYSVHVKFVSLGFSKTEFNTHTGLFSRSCHGRPQLSRIIFRQPIAM